MRPLNFGYEIQGGFLTGPALKSVEDGKFPTQKVKVSVKLHIMLSHSSTLFGAGPVKKHPVSVEECAE